MKQPEPIPSPPPEGLALLLALHNESRNANGLSSLALDGRLCRAAQNHAAWMARNERLSHTGEGGSSPGSRAKAAGYKWIRVGENIAKGYSNERAVFNGWWNSPDHRSNILGPYKHVGFGRAMGDAKYWVALFASPSTLLAFWLKEDETEQPEGLYLQH